MSCGKVEPHSGDRPEYAYGPRGRVSWSPDYKTDVVSEDALRALNLHVIEREAVLRWLLAEARYWAETEIYAGLPWLDDHRTPDA